MSQDKLVAVLWSDVRCDQADMFTREELATRTGVAFTTYGLLVRDDADFVVVAAEICENGALRGVTTIHRALVRSVTLVCGWPKRTRRKPPPVKAETA